jgi:hypothetical protein
MKYLYRPVLPREHGGAYVHLLLKLREFFNADDVGVGSAQHGIHCMGMSWFNMPFALVCDRVEHVITAPVAVVRARRA